METARPSSKQKRPTGWGVNDTSWLRYWSDSNQRSYYFNKTTNLTTYDPPRGVEFSDREPQNDYGSNERDWKRARSEFETNSSTSSIPPSIPNPPRSNSLQNREWKWENLDALIKNDHDRDLVNAALFSLEKFHKIKGQPRDVPKEEHSLVHIERKTGVGGLSASLRKLCLDLGLDKEPPGAYNRWLFVQKLGEPEAKDPLLPYNISVENTLRWELEREKKSKTQTLVTRQEAEEICLKIAEMTTQYVDNEIARTRSRSVSMVEEIAFRELNANQYALTYQGDRITINKEHYDKLLKRYRKHTQDFDTSDTFALTEFHRRLYNLVSRYEALGGAGYQAAIPKPLFALLEERLGVRHECFASPLNCTLESFGSAFFDTDRFFGSQGSFFEMAEDFFIDGGSFEANPPFVELPMLMMALLFEKFLSLAEKPLSFIIFVPAWNDTPAFYSMANSRFNACPESLGKYLLLKKYDHSYHDGAQHRSNIVHRPSGADSMVFFLQNDAARKKWPVTEKLVEDIKRQFK